jgi:hypothetical protein
MAGEEDRATSGAGPQGDEAELVARLEEEIRGMSVADHLGYMLHSLSALAVGRLGLGPDGAGQRDPVQARLAIEAFKALMGVLEQVRPAGEVAAHRGVLAQLQLAYAGAVTAGSPRAEPAEGQAPAVTEAAQAPDDEAPAVVAQAIDAEAPADPEEPVGAEAPAGAAGAKPRKPRRSSQAGS